MGGGSNFSNSNLGGTLHSIDFSSQQLIPFEKDFYIEHPDVSKRPETEAQAWRASKQIVIVGEGIPKPCMTFEEASMPEYVLSEVIKCGFDKPTPIQSQGWPMALKGKNMVGISATGSGKTLAFLLPAMIHINAQQYLKPGEGPIVLVLAPTRELAVQIKEECDKFGASSEIKNTVVYGGVPKSKQVRSLREGVEIVIATPGRLIDHLEQGNTNLKRVTYLVLDEADRMLDMGFEPQLRKIVSQIRPDRQVLMWSATWPKEVQNLARDYLSDFYQVTVGSLDLAGNKDVTQMIDVCSDQDKYRNLLRYLRENLTSKDRVLVFVETKKGCDMLTRSLRMDGFQARAMHGDKSQEERDWVLREFKSCQATLLVATDVAARGLDVDDIKMVVNFDFPNDTETYIHRIGRTGRAGKKGFAVSFFVTEKNGRMARDIIEILNRTQQNVPPELLNAVQTGGGRYGGGGGRGRGGGRRY
ncbi:atp-dependent RNA helicase [Thalassiosira pseudonana CCMP1335]|uniref:RNA helicase n=1 Tax=Thalassiosira pseudonana TaxID=35128 RepID=B8CDF5_THAPS|nr:atp-dependent RNA helicase [Thalassiosira pseudonana CCMP1335]EED88448.1 atp-dependent RNA helicase [Thalassiosira pseudonana CCMP1335]